MKKSISAVAILGIGIAIGSILIRSSGTSIAQAPNPPLPQPQEFRLLANLYMITSGEYRACCLQTYRFAEERLAQKLRCRTHPEKPPAVLMDLDETVFDNAGFQTVLYRDRLVYRDELWDPWERDFPQEVRLVPGAKDFIERAEAAGVTVLYMSNRAERFRDSTKKAIEHNGLSTLDIEGRLLLKKDSSDKSPRRVWAAERFDLLLLVGDNLRDFSEEFRVGNTTTVADRKKAVDQRAEHWGNDWIILPNCVYGEWEKLIKDNPAQHFPASAMPNPDKKTDR
jgi:acid phosphatase